MLNLLPHRRLHVPHGLAIFAALLLIGSSIVGYETSQGVYSSQETRTTVKAENAENDHINDTVERKSGGLKLGLLLFRR
ncbi:hypothetical protein ACFL3I_07225 [Pseudomonadota bacterium]